jgi:5,6-dimethylbenzimidazole synthase
MFDEEFRDKLNLLLAWRRDVRRFRSDPVDRDLLRHLVRQANLSPSVGNSQPWRWISVEGEASRAAVRASFERCNVEAVSTYAGERAAIYAKLKLAGLDAPIHLAVFADCAATAGHGLGRRTMPEMLEYSVVSAITTFWLSARAHGLGVGWVSILDPIEVAKSLHADPSWKLIAYLCVGYPIEEHEDPELIRFGWQDRIKTPEPFLVR